MPDELVLYTNPMSRGRIARWALEEVGQPYHTEILDWRTGMKTPAFLAINPMGKVPALRHGSAIITETPAIIAYLADAFPDCGFAPPIGDAARGAYYRWLFFTAGPFEAAVTNQALGFVLPEGKDRMAGYGSFAAVMDAMEQAITPGPFLLGAQFSAADLYLGAQIGFIWARRSGSAWPSARSKSGLPSWRISRAWPNARPIGAPPLSMMR